MGTTELERIALRLREDLWLGYRIKFHSVFLADMLIAEAPECLLGQAIMLGRRMIGGDMATRDRFFVVCRAALETQRRVK